MQEGSTLPLGEATAIFLDHMLPEITVSPSHAPSHVLRKSGTAGLCANYIRLNFTLLDEAAIETGVRVLGRNIWFIPEMIALPAV